MDLGVNCDGDPWDLLADVFALGMLPILEADRFATWTGAFNFIFRSESDQPGCLLAVGVPMCTVALAWDGYR